MIQARERTRLVLHAPREIFARAELGVERLQHVALADRRVLDVVDRAHSARADPTHDAIHRARDELAGLVIACLHRGAH